MLTTLTTALSSMIRRAVSSHVEAAILAGTADGINSAAAKLGMTEEFAEPEEIPTLEVEAVKTTVAKRKTK